MDRQLKFGYEWWVNPIGVIISGEVILDEIKPIELSEMANITEPGLYRIIVTGDLVGYFDGNQWVESFEEVYFDGTGPEWQIGSGDLPTPLCFYEIDLDLDDKL